MNLGEETFWIGEIILGLFLTSFWSLGLLSTEMLSTSSFANY
jgi:hypothetical protein